MASEVVIDGESDPLRLRMRESTLRGEKEILDDLLASLGEVKLAGAVARATSWVSAARNADASGKFVASLTKDAHLATSQGRALMSLAESLLRTPDATRSTQLIAEQLAAVRASPPLAGSDFPNRAAFALLGAVGGLLPSVSDELAARVTSRSVSGAMVAPLTRATLRAAMRAMAAAFIAGGTIEAALERGRKEPALSFCSFDMLGEGARTEQDASQYFRAYLHAIERLGQQTETQLHRRSGISVKLSALEPRYTPLKRALVHEGLLPRLRKLARAAAAANIGLTVDAEEADRLDLSLDLMSALSRDDSTRDWAGLGLAVQAYGRRAPLVVDWIAQLARRCSRAMTVRLVKGAYWDSEIKQAQEKGLASFPVFTHKAATDVSYLACARRLFSAADVIYPQFATHNALTLAAIHQMAPPGSAYEFQRLHGMGEELYRVVRADVRALAPVRVYAPVGTHEALLPYLIRRLLENGANTSFVHQSLDRHVPIEDVVKDPLETAPSLSDRSTDPIREPVALYGPHRRNSLGVDFGNPLELAALLGAVRSRGREAAHGGPIVAGECEEGPSEPVTSPSNQADVVGHSRDASREEVRRALDSAAASQRPWNATPVQDRAACLDRAAQMLESRRDEFIMLLVREAGKTLPDAVAEIRETVDFCRYYAAQARELFGEARALAGPTGEKNLLSLHGWGVFVCISPWNFPLAIFGGQVTAALAAGNSVIAKPAPATPLIAHRMVRLLHEAGVPKDVLHLTPLADGPQFAEWALRHPAVAGVAFTGSTKTATAINRVLASREGALVTLIAETGGLNAMVVDSTAPTERVVDDVMASAFTSVGQRCSALRVLYLQAEVADRTIEMLVGAMKLLKVGDPADPATDLGPVISQPALAALKRYSERMEAESVLHYRCDLPNDLPPGHFFAPRLFELQQLDQVKTEEFGPILHVARYQSAELPSVLDAVRGTGFGLTLGVHSRLEGFAQHVFGALRVGNTYVNRNMIGAVVGVQPFGGCGLSGTGPKAGGPHYLLRFATERTLTINMAAVGGDVELLSRTIA